MYDVIVVGTGSGKTVATRCASAGKKVAIVDDSPYGGTCALRGCDPKKILVGLAHALDISNRLEKIGVDGNTIPNWSGAMTFKNSFTDEVPDQREKDLKKAGIDTYHGKCRFVSANELEVNGNRIKAKQFVIAAGAKPQTLSIPGEELLMDSTAFLAMEVLPKEIVFVGGGYIAFEFAHIAVRFGAKATILHKGERPLEQFDADIISHLTKVSRDLGIRVHLDTEVKSISNNSDQLVVHAEHKGTNVDYEADAVIHAAGRVPSIDDLELENANIIRTERGVEVNDFLQSVSNPHVYACGDASSRGLNLTPVAGKESIIVADNILKGNTKKIDFGHVPSCVFSIPSVAMVGMTEETAKQQGVEYEVKYEDTTQWYSSKRINEKGSAYKIVIDKKSDEILGAHLMGPHAEEVINIFALAMNAGITASQLRKTIFSYPTNASDIVYMV